MVTPKNFYGNFMESLKKIGIWLKNRGVKLITNQLLYQLSYTSLTFFTILKIYTQTKLKLSTNCVSHRNLCEGGSYTSILATQS
jgi:hypothetical protein